MPEEINNKKLDYLKREEVRTMGKDIAQLRERESEATREKITQIKTGEETGLEAARIEQSKRAAQEREGLESEAKRKGEELEKIRERKAADLSAEAASEEAKAEEEKEQLRTQLKEAQLKEEEARRKFLENIARQSGEVRPEGATENKEAETKPYEPPAPPPIRPIPPVPPLPADLSAEAPGAKVETPPPKKPFKFPLPSFNIPEVRMPKVQLPEVKLPKVEGYFPEKPSIFKKIWIRILISLFVLAVLTILVTFWYWYLAVRPQIAAPLPPAAETVQEEKLEITQMLLQSGYFLPVSARVIGSIIIHSGYNKENPYDLESAIQSYSISGTAVHYLISRGGAVFQLAPDYAVAYHAGNANNISIGISLIYQESEGPNEAQYQSLSRLIKNLQEKYNIPLENVRGYKDISPAKTTPWNFDWDKFNLLISFAAPSPLSAEEGAGFILANLTSEEKIGQLFIVGFDGTELTPELENFMKSVRPGGIILFKKNIENAPQVKKLIQDLQKISLAETGLPLLAAIDYEGGTVSRIDFAKEKIGQSEIENSAQAYEVGLARGGELKELGINLNLSPVLDLTQPGDFLRERSFQKEAAETGILAKALVAGQKAAGIFTAIKHFPGYGGIPFNPEKKLTAVTGVPQTLHFQKAMEASPEFIMLASVIYPNLDADLPIAFSKNGISFLKKELGETPLVTTDDLLQKSFLDNFTLKEITTLPIKAGADILLFSGGEEKIKDASAVLAKAAQSGDLPEKLIDRAVLRIIQLKQAMR